MRMKNSLKAITNSEKKKQKKRKRIDRSSHQRCSARKGVPRKFAQNARENICARVSFLIKLQAETDFGASVFL